MSFSQSPVTTSNIEALAAQITKDQQSYTVSQQVIEEVAQALRGITVTDKFIYRRTWRGSGNEQEKFIHVIHSHIKENG